MNNNVLIGFLDEQIEKSAIISIQSPFELGMIGNQFYFFRTALCILQVVFFKDYYNW